MINEQKQGYGNVNQPNRKAPDVLTGSKPNSRYAENKTGNFK